MENGLIGHRALKEFNPDTEIATFPSIIHLVVEVHIKSKAVRMILVAIHKLEEKDKQVVMIKR